MLLMLDANCCAAALRMESEFPSFVRCLLLGKGRLSIGGTKMLEEYNRISEMSKFLIALDRAGKIERIDRSAVDKMSQDLESRKVMDSDDPHVIAVACLSGARVLCTKDRALIRDFTAGRFFQPRGKIYSGERNRKLLEKALPKAKVK